MGFYTQREDDTNGKVIKTGDNVRIIKTNEKGFVIAILNDEYMVSIDGNVENYYKDELEWLDS